MLNDNAKAVIDKLQYIIDRFVKVKFYPTPRKIVNEPHVIEKQSDDTYISFFGEIVSDKEKYEVRVFKETTLEQSFPDFNEYTLVKTMPTKANECYVDRENNLIYFHSSQDTSEISITYYSIGIGMLSSALVYTHFDSNNKVIETLYSLTKKCQEELDRISTVTNAEQLKVELQSYIESLLELVRLYPNPQETIAELQRLLSEVDFYSEEIRATIEEAKVFLNEIKIGSNKFVEIKTTDWEKVSGGRYKFEYYHNLNTKNLIINTTEIINGIETNSQIDYEKPNDNKIIFYTSDNTIRVKAIMSASYYPGILGDKEIGVISADNLEDGVDKVVMTREERDALKTLNRNMDWVDVVRKECVILSEYAINNRIDTSIDWTEAIDSAISYCIKNSKNLYITNGTYFYNKDTLRIEKEGELGFEIIGENITKTILVFKNNGIKLTNTSQVIEYSKRISFVKLSNLTIRKTPNTSSQIGLGLDISKFGYIELENIRIRDFKEGLRLTDGSEFDMFTSQILGNDIGIHLIKTTSDGQSDMANINFWGTKVHNNNTTLVADGLREVSFNNCVLMNYKQGMFFNGFCTLVNMNNCDLENSSESSDLIINAPVGTFNINQCVFANPCTKKIVLKSGSKALLNMTKNVMDNTVAPIILIENGFLGSLNTDILYNNIYVEGDMTFDSYTKNELINCINWDFSKQNIAPYAVSSPFSVDTDNFVTGNCSISFEANSSEKYISFDMTNFIGNPTMVEVILRGNDSNNVIRLVYKNGEVVYNYTVGGSDIKTQDFSNGFKKIISILPKEKTDNPIKAIQIMLKENTIPPKIDSVKIYGKNVQNGEKLYSDSIPTKGVFSLGEFVYNKKITEIGEIGSKYIVPYWICVAEPNTFIPYKILTGK